MDVYVQHISPLQLKDEASKSLIEICDERNIPLILLQSYGLLGSMKVESGHIHVLQ